MKIALLDDWQNNALTFAEFERLKLEHQLDVLRIQLMALFW